MNLDHYAAAAEAHMRINLADRYSQIENPESYFRRLGEQIAAQVAQLETALAASEPASEDYLTRVGQLTSARARAEEIVFVDLVYLPAEELTELDTQDPPTKEGDPADDATRDGSGPGGLGGGAVAPGFGPGERRTAVERRGDRVQGEQSRIPRTTRRSPIPLNPGRPSPTLPSPRGSDGNS